MTKYTPTPMRPELVVCPKSDCGANDHIGIQSHTERRSICHTCQRTFAETTGTMLYGLKHPSWLVLLVCQGQVELGQVQADELYTKTQAGPVWVATALTVFSRLWLWGTISWQRDVALVEPLIEQVRAAAQPGQPILFAVDGFKAYLPCILKTFRDPVRLGKPGRPRLVVWPNLHIVQVVKQRVGRRLISITRRLAHGSLTGAEAIMQATQVELGRINTAYIERLNATLRTWMPALVRRTRTPLGARVRLEAALFWTGCVYNFCHVHATLAGTPAMAADLTDHVWSIEELIRYRCRRE